MPKDFPAPFRPDKRLIPIAFMVLGLAGTASVGDAATVLGRCQTDSEKGFHEVAIPACNRLIDSAGTRPSVRALALYFRANSLFSTGNTEAALSDIETSLAISPENGVAHALKGRILARSGQSQAAVASLSRAVALGFTEPQVLRLRGDLLLELGEAERAMSDLRAVVLGAPRDAVALTQLALAEEQAGRREAALDTVGRAIAANSDYAPARGVRAAIRSAAGDIDGALEDYAAAVAHDEADARYRLGRADLLQRADKPAEALGEVEAALALQPGLEPALLLKADILEAQGRWAKALEALEASGRTEAPMLLRRARLALRLERYAAAVPLYDRAIEAGSSLDGPQLAAAYFERGQARQRLGEAEAAAADYSEALLRSPELVDRGLLLLRGKARFAVGDMVAALADFEAAAAGAPDAEAPRIWLALTLAELADFDRAEAAARQVVERAPGSARAHALLGDVLLKAGNLDAGRAEHEKALELEPGYATSRRRLEEISRTQ